MQSGDPIEKHFPRMKSGQKKALGKLGIRTLRDLLYHFPARYENAGPTGTITSVTPGAEVTLFGTVRKPDVRKAWKSRKPLAEAWLEDNSGKIKMMWFSQPYIAKTLHDGMHVRVTGRIAGEGAKAYLANPKIEKSAIEPGNLHNSLFARTEDLNVKHLNPEDVRESLFNTQVVRTSDVLTTEEGHPMFTDAALHSVYPESKGVSSLWITHAVKKLFEAGVHERIEDPIPGDILARYKLPSLASALVFIHAPRKKSDADAARKRFAFEEIFALQVVMQMRRRAHLAEEALPVTVDRKALQDFIASYPFPATDAQLSAIDSIVSDFEQRHPMLRLLEGDVGSGKTAVAAATAYLVVTSLPPKVLERDKKLPDARRGQAISGGVLKGTTEEIDGARNAAAGAFGHVRGGYLQVAYLVPTEILAKQHFSTFVSYFKDHPIPIGLITGNECRVFPSKIRYEESAKISKAAFKKRVAEGTIPIVIGTHALVEKTLTFKYFAYAIIDEQHRFGTMHRQKLATKGAVAPQEYFHFTNADDREVKWGAPHLLSMTATPIPRTLALTLYGDLDLTLLDQMPSGRKPIKTEVLGPEKREEAYARVRAELVAGRQAYVICPRIDEPDPTKELALQAKSVVAEAARLKKEVFPHATIGILHSKMRPAEKEEAMQKFEKGETQILVATSVVEVGVNVPNATVILIEGAERFGLAQLHQLRGRVIRSNHQAYCFALPESFGQATKDRMKAFTQAKNGFELAEYDLGLRGAGELTGGRQWGVSDIAMEALKNLKLVEAARTEAAKLVAVDPDLRAHPTLALRARAADAEMHLE